jgi:hypothetical protein
LHGSGLCGFCGGGPEGRGDCAVSPLGPILCLRSLRSDNYHCSRVTQDVPVEHHGNSNGHKTDKRDAGLPVDLLDELLGDVHGDQHGHGHEATNKRDIGVGVGLGLDLGVVDVNVNLVLEVSTKISNVCLGAHLVIEIFGDKSSEAVHALSSSMAQTMGKHDLLGKIDAVNLATAIVGHLDLSLSHGHGSKVAEVCAAVEFACDAAGIDSAITAEIVADVKVNLDVLGLDVEVDVSLDVSLFKHDLVNAFLGIEVLVSLFAHVDVKIDAVVAVLVEKIVACLQLDASLHLDVNLVAKIVAIVQAEISNGGYDKGNYQGQTLVALVVKIVVDACLELNVGLDVAGLKVGLEAGLGGLLGL